MGKHCCSTGDADGFGLNLMGLLLAIVIALTLMVICQPRPHRAYILCRLPWDSTPIESSRSFQVWFLYGINLCLWFSLRMIFNTGIVICWIILEDDRFHLEFTHSFSNKTVLRCWVFSSQTCHSNSIGTCSWLMHLEHSNNLCLCVCRSIYAW